MNKKTDKKLDLTDSDNKSIKSIINKPKKEVKTLVSKLSKETKKKTVKTNVI